MGADTERHASPPRDLRTGAPLRVLFVGQMRPCGGSRGCSMPSSANLPCRRRSSARPANSSSCALTPIRLAPRTGVSGQSVTTRLPALRDARRDRPPVDDTRRSLRVGAGRGDGGRVRSVASDLPGVRDVAGPSGVLHQPRDSSSLRAALLELADDPARVHCRSHASQPACARSRLDADRRRVPPDRAGCGPRGHRRRARAVLPRTWATRTSPCPSSRSVSEPAGDRCCSLEPRPTRRSRVRGERMCRRADSAAASRASPSTSPKRGSHICSTASRPQDPGSMDDPRGHRQRDDGAGGHAGRYDWRSEPVHCRRHGP